MTIDYVRDGHVVTITVNRPEAHNSLDMEHFRALLGVWTRFRDDESAWVAVVTRTGKAFCTGADLKSFIPELTGTVDRPHGWDRPDALHAVLHGSPSTSQSSPLRTACALRAGWRCSGRPTSGWPRPMPGSR